MKLQKRFINAGMDTDSSMELIDQNDLIYAFNARTLGTDEKEGGVVTSIEGNEIIPYPLPSGKNLCIGAKAFDGVDKAYYFIWNENNRHKILEYDYVSNSIYSVFENISDSGGLNILKFTSASFVKDIELIDGRHLKFNDAVLSPKEIDIQRVRDGEYGVFSWLDLEQIKEQPMTPPVSYYISNGFRNSNNMVRNLYQFRYKFIYWNDEDSAFSEYSKRQVPTDESTPSSVSDSTKNNGQVVTIKTGSNRVKSYVISARHDNLDWQTIKRIDAKDVLAIKTTAVDLSTEIYEAYDPIKGEYSFVFYNDGLSEPDDPLFSDLAYDSLPDRANAMELANGNVIIFGGISEGKARPQTGIKLGVSYYDPEISIAPTDLNNAMRASFSQDRISGSHRRRVRVYITGKPKLGDVIQLYTIQIENGNTQKVAEWTVTFAQENANDLNSVMYELSKNLYKVHFESGANPWFEFVTETMWELQTVKFTYANRTSGASKSIPIVKTNSSYQAGLAYRGNFGKYYPLQSNSNTILNTKSQAQTGGLIPSIDWEITDLKAPVGAVDYQWVLTENNTHQAYLQINGTIKSIEEKNFIDISLKSLLKFNRANPTSLLTYQWSAGDRCTFICRYQDGTNPKYFSTKLIDVDVISFKPVPTSGTDPTLTDYVLRVRRPVSISETGVYDAGDNILGKEAVIELYTPKKTVDGQEVKVYYEIGDVYPIDANGNHTVLKGSIKQADAYLKTRESEYATTDNKFSVFQVESPDFSDFYKSNFYSFGRARSYYDTSEEVYLKASVRYSDTFNKFTKSNGLNRFYSERLVDYDEVYGAIWYLEQRDNVVITVQDVKVGYIPINQSILEDQTGKANVAVSDVLLNQIRYSKGINIGIGKAIRSFVSYGSNVYFIDPNRCEPVRVGLDGVVSISKKMSKFFKKILREAFREGRDVIGFYDIYNNEFIISFTTVSGQVISIPISEANWRVDDSYVLNPNQLVVPTIQFNGTATYNPDNGVATFTPNEGFKGSAGIRFSFPDGDKTVLRGECITVIEGETTLDDIMFLEQFDVPLSTNIPSNIAMIGGINSPQKIEVISGKVSINGGEWVDGIITVEDGDTIAMQNTSSNLYFEKTSVSIKYNTNSIAVFSVTTIKVGNDLMSEVFKRECTGSLVGSDVTYVVPANKHMAKTKSLANAMALQDISDNGQSYANDPANGGTCTAKPPVKVNWKIDRKMMPFVDGNVSINRIRSGVTSNTDLLTYNGEGVSSGQWQYDDILRADFFHYHLGFRWDDTASLTGKIFRGGFDGVELATITGGTVDEAEVGFRQVTLDSPEYSVLVVTNSSATNLNTISYELINETSIGESVMSLRVDDMTTGLDMLNIAIPAMNVERKGIFNVVNDSNKIKPIINNPSSLAVSVRVESLTGQVKVFTVAPNSNGFVDGVDKSGFKIIISNVSSDVYYLQYFINSTTGTLKNVSVRLINSSGNPVVVSEPISFDWSGISSPVGGGTNAPVGGSGIITTGQSEVVVFEYDSSEENVDSIGVSNINPSSVDGHEIGGS